MRDLNWKKFRNRQMCFGNCKETSRELLELVQMGLGYDYETARTIKSRI